MVTAVEVCKHLGMSTEQAQKASPAEQERFGFGACIGVVIMFLAVVLLVKASSLREVASGCLPLVVGAELMLPRGERSGRAVRVVRTVLLAVGVALVVVSIAVL
ncbi:hypothetical protein [Kineococcus arenarius]|uniref:hypothetical protein n=1 Tax=unclassified Kineococcus TaxID=2621656 RepID=UPI003D7D6BC5